MGKNIKKDHSLASYCYICPHCGNDAMPVMKYNTPISCKYCGGSYTKKQRIKIKM